MPGSKLDPTTAQAVLFVFPRCQARLDGADLLVTIPAPGVTVRGATTVGEALQWGEPEAAAGDVTVECEPGARHRLDRSEYPVSPAYVERTAVRFRGGFSYGRVVFGDGWALGVQAVVRSGVPAAWEAVVYEQTAPERTMAAATATDADAGVMDGPVNGPHLPYP